MHMRSATLELLLIFNYINDVKSDVSPLDVSHRFSVVLTFKNCQRSEHGG